MPEFSVIVLGTDVPREGEEQLGSKPKFWFRHSDGKRWLFKYARAQTGEHWAEKVAAEIAGALSLPHATVELAKVGDSWGAITRDFTDEGRSGLVHGNELLTELDPEYPTADRYHVRAHTLSAVRDVLDQGFITVPALANAPDGFSAFDAFVGYLMLDAVIGNTGRHHENWGILLTSSNPRIALLAPTFDHASSLGRELNDEVRRRKYGDPANDVAVAAYVAKARSALFRGCGDLHPLPPSDAFLAAKDLAPSAGLFWLERLRECQDAVRAVPDGGPWGGDEHGSSAVLYASSRSGSEKIARIDADVLRAARSVRRLA